MKRPLLVTDCDEVLLHMARHFRRWLREERNIDFSLEGRAFADSMRRSGSDEPVDEEEMWQLLGDFFDTQMHTQTPIPGAVEAIARLQQDADVVVLTNLADKRNEARTRQLRRFGITAPVVTNQGLKGAALLRIVEQYGASQAVFIDDIARHHESVARVAPQVRRLQFCGEPEIAPMVPCAFEAGHADARIDTWDKALPWLLRTLHGEQV